MMLLITREQREKLLENGRNSGKDHTPVVKLFTPDGPCTWLLTEILPSDPTIAFGLCDLGQGYPELGYVDLTEISSVRGKLGLEVERDLYVTLDKPISWYAEEAQKAGRITV